MGKSIVRFENLEVCQEAMALAGQIYQRFHNSRDYGFRDQIRRSAVSIPSDKAEGYERQSNKEFVQFLFISRGSAGEHRTQLSLASEVELIEKEKGMELIERSRKTSAMLSKFTQTRETNF